MTAQIRAVKLNRVLAGKLDLIHKRSHFMAQQIINPSSYSGPLTPVSDAQGFGVWPMEIAVRLSYEAITNQSYAYADN